MLTKTSSFGFALRVGLGVIVLATIGCQTVDPVAVQSFSVGVTSVQAQSKSAFDTVAVLTRESSIQYAITQPTLSESSFVTVPDAAAIAAWEKLLKPVEAYAQSLAILVSIKSTEQVESAVANLASDFNTTSQNLHTQAGMGSGLQIGAGSASAFAGVASALLRAKASKEAKSIALEVDPQIRILLVSLGDVIGSDVKTPGLRATVASNWGQKLGMLQGQFLAKDSPAAREAVARKFVEFLNQRDAQDEMLAGIRRSLLTLADAHSALATGRTVDLKSAIDYVAAELKHTRELKKQFTETLYK